MRARNINILASGPMTFFGETSTSGTRLSSWQRSKRRSTRTSKRIRKKTHKRSFLLSGIFRIANCVDGRTGRATRTVSPTARNLSRSCPRLGVLLVPSSKPTNRHGCRGNPIVGNRDLLERSWFGFGPRGLEGKSPLGPCHGYGIFEPSSEQA